MDMKSAREEYLRTFNPGWGPFLVFAAMLIVQVAIIALAFMVVWHFVQKLW